MDSRDRAIRSGVRAELVTVAWMIAEAALAIIAGIRARSVLITAFGLDSAIELVSGVVLLWRLRHEGRADVDVVERRASRVSAWLLVALCLYVLITGTLGALRRSEPEESLVGLAVSAVAVVAMPLLAMWKRRVNETLQSDALRADIAETMTCGYLALIVLAGVAANRIAHAWWIEYAATALLLLWLIHETKEAFERAHDA
jgi:divalent metal cation (Fe/Co/Zn/Cd) transporter